MPRSSRLSPPVLAVAALAVLCAALAHAGYPARADVLAPKSGKAVEGAIVSESDAEVVFNVYWSRNPGVTNPEHILRLPRDKVKRLERAPHPEVEVFRRLAAPDLDAAALTAIGSYAKENKLKAHARMCFALALAKDENHLEALKGLGGRAKWASVRKGNPLLDAELQGLLERYVALEAPEERVALQRTLKERGFAAKPHELERYRRGVHQATGLQVDRPVSYRSDVRPGAVYTLFVPKTYTPAKPWPLIIGLHGGGPDGKQGDEVVGSGPSAMNFYQSQAARHGFLVACPTALMAGWPNKPNEEYVRDLIVELCWLYHIDIDRIYLTGHSMGGFGTWGLGPRLAEDLAAISPMAGAGGGGVGRLVSTKTPIFIYHSDNDFIAVGSDRSAAEQLRGSGLDFVYTELPGQGHGFPASVQAELFEFFAPRRRFDKAYKESWPRSSFLGKVTKEEILYLGDPMAEIKGQAPDLKAWLADLRLGGGRALAAVARLVEARPEGVVEGVAKVLASPTVPFDARAYAAEILGRLGDAAGLPALRKAIALPATKEQSAPARACAAALCALQDVEALPALEKAIEAWTLYYESKVMSSGMRYSDWHRSSTVLAELLGAWSTLAPEDARSAPLERSVVVRVLEPQHKVETSERVPQDPSQTRAAIAAALGRAYKRTNAESGPWDKLLAALGNDEKARAAAEAART
jgi:dienelactone hydrolase